MTEQPTPEGNLAAELRQLGNNLAQVLRSAWDQPERKHLQQEIVNGLNEMGTTIREETRKFSDSPTGQRLKTEVSNVTQRVQTGEVEARARQELLNALQVANQQIQRAIDHLTERSAPDLDARQPAGEYAPFGSQEGDETVQSDAATTKGGQPINPDNPNYWNQVYPRSEGLEEVGPDDQSAPPAETGHNEVHPDDV